MRAPEFSRAGNWKFQTLSHFWSSEATFPVLGGCVICNPLDAKSMFLNKNNGSPSEGLHFQCLGAILHPKSGLVGPLDALWAVLGRPGATILGAAS